MSNLQDVDPRFKHIGRKVFVFVFVAVLIILGTIFFLGREKDLFSPKDKLYFMTDTAFGFSEGMSVKLAGFRIGKIYAVSLDENAKVIVEIEVKKKYKKWIRQDSTASLKKEGYVGEGFIEISFGSLNKLVLADGAEITYQKARGIEDIAKEMVEELKPVVAEVKNFVQYITNPKGDITRILKNTADLTAELNKTAIKAQEIIQETKPLIKSFQGIASDVKQATEKIPDMTKEINKSVDNVNNLTKNIKEDVPAILNETKKIMNNINKITGDVARETPRVKPVLSNVEDITEDTRDITDSVKKNWFIKRNIQATSEPTYLSPALPVFPQGGKP
jgi:phospholipid/cholesterol/gamma-HCH transport system substrate-binding protein